jgi:BASS family bile acid:Na+ symporter
MDDRQLALSVVLVAMVFSVALELRVDDFRRVLTTPRGIVAGLIPQFLLLPVASWLVTLVLDLPADVEAAMLLVAACPGGSLSNVITHLGGGDTALSVSLSAVAGVAALVLTPFNFSWTVATNPATADWLRELAISPNEIASSLLVLLALPMAAGLALAQRVPALAARLRKPLSRTSLVALFAFIVIGLYRDRALLDLAILPLFAVVVGQNAAGLALGNLCARAFGLEARARRAVVIEAGMQNAGLALGIIALQFGGDVGMVVIASLWGIWHIVTGLGLATYWRRLDARSDL